MKNSQAPAAVSPGAQPSLVQTSGNVRRPSDHRAPGDQTPVPPAPARDPGAIEYASWLPLLQRSVP